MSGKRLREIDFLRGSAIILVLFRHQQLFEFTTNLGWIGVDLFFVLSGFLVSTLLFKEYQRFGKIRPGRFLVRRGFKIYPIYFLFYPLYIPLLRHADISLPKVASDLLFVQNYVNGWGYAYFASWSLAVEEHFYFLLSIALWIVLRNGRIALPLSDSSSFSGFEKAVFAIMFSCLLLRFYSNSYLSVDDVRDTTMTHLRIDSLLAGVWIAFVFQFRNQWLARFYERYKYGLFCVAVTCLCWTPFISPVPSFFVRTIGFLLLYVAFGIVLLFFLLSARINQRLDRIFTPFVVSAVSSVGYCSYSIYIIHTFINGAFHKAAFRFGIEMPQFAIFLLTSTASIAAGYFMTHYIEEYFLKMRNRLYPGRS